MYCNPMRVGNGKIYHNKMMRLKLFFIFLVFILSNSVNAQETDSTQIHIYEDSLTHQSSLTMLTETLEYESASSFWEKEKWGASIASVIVIGTTIYLQSESDKFYKKYQDATTTEKALLYKSNSQEFTNVYHISLSVSAVTVCGAILGWLIDK